VPGRIQLIGKEQPLVLGDACMSSSANAWTLVGCHETWWENLVQYGGCCRLCHWTASTRIAMTYTFDFRKVWLWNSCSWKAGMKFYLPMRMMSSWWIWHIILANLEADACILGEILSKFMAHMIWMIEIKDSPHQRTLHKNVILLWVFVS
jgi:hypothetical protein